MNISKGQKRNTTAQYFPELCKYEFETKTIFNKYIISENTRVTGSY